MLLRPAALFVNLRARLAFRRAVRAFRRELGYTPNIAVPVTYHEKMFWRRIVDHNPAFVAYCDKLAAKEIFLGLDDPVAVPETLWTGTRPEDLPDALMRPDVVVKLNAGCNSNWFFARDGTDRGAFELACRKWLSKPFGTETSEWGYWPSERRLMAEAVIAADRADIAELKVHLFGDEIFYTNIYLSEKTPGSKSAIFDADGNRLAVTNSTVARDPSRALPAGFRVPACYPRAMAAARAIARDSDYLRVDFMVVGDRLYGGEITPYPTAGLMTNSDPEVMAEMGRRWDLARSWFLSAPQAGWRGWYQRALRRHVEKAKASGSG
jgi:hypothetical protein